MANYTPAETSKWVAGNLRKAEDVSKVEVLSDQVLRVSRSRYDPFVAGIVSAKCVEAETVEALVISELGVEIIANVPKESYWTGDLLRVIRLQNVRAFQPEETEFVERGLRQHNRISSFKRVYDRIYRVSRLGLPDLTVAMLNEYELTADYLRTARDRYGPFSVAVITNPNGKATSTAKEVAQTIGVEILNWGSFFGRLNKQ